MAAVQVLHVHPGPGSVGIVVCPGYDPSAWAAGLANVDIHISGSVKWDPGSGMVSVSFDFPVSAGTNVRDEQGLKVAAYTVVSTVPSPKVGTSVTATIAYSAADVTTVVNTDP